MLRRYLALFMLCVVAWATGPAAAQAQALRPDETFFVKPRVGIAFYLGDNEQSPANFNMDNWKVDGELPYAGGFEIGYQFNQNFGLSLGWQIASHPLIFYYGDTVPPQADLEDDQTVYNGAQLLARFGGAGRVAPFVAIGGHVTDGNDGRTSLTYGPAAGLGLDFLLGDRTSLVLEWLANFTFPDDGIDAVEENVFNDDFAPFDLSNTVTLGLKYNFKSAAVAPMLAALDCPARLTVGESGTFSASLTNNASTPLEYRWDFGDNATAQGLLATHAFSTPGTYTVNFNATNRAGMAEQSCVVEVVPEPVPAAVVTFGADRNEFELCEPQTVTFNAEVRGDAPVQYAWDLDGDGTTDATGQTATFRYTEPGTYTATLTVTNAAGSDTRTVTIRALDCTSICEDITELNSVYFERNASTLSAEARAALAENVELLSECPNLCVRVEGFAAPGERNPQALSTDRAEAVAQYYRDNGMAGSRILAMGMGRVGGTTSKKEGTAQFQRADSIPVPCDELGDGDDD